MSIKEKTVYIDAHATTPVDTEVLAAMLPYFTEYFGNGSHREGRKTTSAAEEARFKAAHLIGSRPSEIVFTGGATEAINLALLGLANGHRGDRNHIITQKTEHKAVLNTIAALEYRGFRVTRLETDQVGRISLKDLEETISCKTLVVAIMLANNEIGTVQPVSKVGKICRKYGAKFFCDLTQGIGWHPVDVDAMNIDFAAFSSHKIYGPRGVGALYARRWPKVKLESILFGGGQEKGIRPGTLNIPGIVGFGKACELQQSNGTKDWERIQAMRDHLYNTLISKIGMLTLNGCPENRHPGNLNISIPKMAGEELMEALPNIIFSTSSACTSGSAEPSHVIKAISKDGEDKKGAFRLGLNKYNTIQEVDFVVDQIAGYYGKRYAGKK